MKTIKNWQQFNEENIYGPGWTTTTTGIPEKPVQQPNKPVQQPDAQPDAPMHNLMHNLEIHIFIIFIFLVLLRNHLMMKKYLDTMMIQEKFVKN